MKKIYLTPQTVITTTELSTAILALSNVLLDSSDANKLDSEDILTKSSRQDYNVWDEDWSK